MASNWKDKASNFADGFFGGSDDEDSEKNKDEDKGITDKVVDNIKDKGQSFFDDIKDKVSDKRESISDKFNDKADEGSGFFGRISDKVEEKKDAISNKIGAKTKDGSGFFDRIVDKVDDKGEAITDKIVDKVRADRTGTGFLDKMSDKVEEKKGVISDKISDKAKERSGIFDNITDKLEDKGESMSGKISDQVDKVKASRDNTGIFDKLKDKFTDNSDDDEPGITDKIVDKGKDILGKLKDKFGSSDEEEEGEEGIADKVEDKVEEGKGFFENISDKITDKFDDGSDTIYDKMEKVKDAPGVLEEIRSRSSSRPASGSQTSRSRATSTSDPSDELNNDDIESNYIDDALNNSQLSVKSDRKSRNDTPSKKGVVDFRQKTSSFDVTLKTAQGDLYCNKAVLIMWSGYFKRRFMFEFKSMKKVEMDVDDDISMEEMEELLRVIYPPNKPIDESNVESIIVLAKKFESQELARRSEGYLMKIKPSADLMLKALKYDLPSVERRCVEYLKMQSSTKWTPPADFVDELDLSSCMKLYAERIRWLETSAHSQALKKTEAAKEKFKKVLLTWSDFKQLVDRNDLDRDTILDLCTEGLEIASKNPGKVLEKAPETPDITGPTDPRPPFDLSLQPGPDKGKLKSTSPRNPLATGLSPKDRLQKPPRPVESKSPNRKAVNRTPKPKHKSPYNTSMRKKASPRNDNTRPQESDRFSESKYVNDFAVSSR